MATRYVLAVLAALGAAACADSTVQPAPTTTTAIATTTTLRPDDGRLTIGVVSPRGGANAELGASVRAGVDLAVADINRAGGVNGHDVATVQRDEGDNAAATAVAVQDLVQLGVDAIVGPTSSLDVLGTLRTTVRAGIVSCSPTATALSLDAFPADNLFFRTIASDSLQAHAIARLVEQTGSDTAAVVYLDDAFGRPFADEVQRLLQAQGTSIALAMGVDGSESSLQRTVAEVAAQRPPVVVVVADASTGPGIIAAIDSARAGLRPTFVVNDQLRRPSSQAAPLSGSLAARVVGASPLAFPPAAFLEQLRTIAPDTTGVFAVNAFDCVNTIALAAQSTGSANPRTFATSVSTVTDNGSSCTTFSGCAPYLAAGRNIDYDGPNGTLTINPRGVVTNALFDKFGFDDTGRDVSTGTLDVASG